MIHEIASYKVSSSCCTLRSTTTALSKVNQRKYCIDVAGFKLSILVDQRGLAREVQYPPSETVTAIQLAASSPQLELLTIVTQ